MKIFISGAGNNASGGTKVLNQVVNLFRKKGFEAYDVVPDNPQPATFLNEPAPTISCEEMVKRCERDDIIIDFWPQEKLYRATMACPAKIKVFWQHGASIPSGPGYTGEYVFQPDSGYNQHWNVSDACKKYMDERYSIQSHIVHPFFDSTTMLSYENQRNNEQRTGILLLQRRGSSIIPKVIQRFGKRTKITIIAGTYHEEDFFTELLRHKIFINIDAGIDNVGLQTHLRRWYRRIIKKERPNSWLLPKGHLLGFPMPPVEAALCGASIVTFAMGGGHEWMLPENCFLARDRDYEDLLNKIESALQTSESVHQKKNELAFKECKKFSQENTWNQIKHVLPL